MYKTILYSTENAIATVTLNRPEALNTIVPPMPDEVEHAIGESDHFARGWTSVLCRIQLW